jgi:hypothetical protein
VFTVLDSSREPLFVYYQKDFDKATMVQFARSLLSWLAASQTPSAGPSVRSCSDSFITTADGSLQVGEIFILVEADNSKLCRDDCSVLFREILSDEGNGVYRTAPASFSQVFPAETYDSSYHDTAVESILPSCNDEALRETKIARRFLEDAARKHDTISKEDDDKHVEDDDDYQYKKSSCEEFYDATKKFIFDMYCIIRSLECTDYDPTHDDVYYADDDVYTKDSKDYRRRLQEAPSKTSRGMRGVKGRSSRRLEEPAPDPEGVSSEIVTFEGESHKDSTKSTEDDDHPEDDFFDDE